MKNFLLIGLIMTSLCAACSATDQCSGAATSLHILFIGNSYTYVNDLPGVFTQLACSGGHKVVTGMAATGGWRLADHAASAQSLALISGTKWDWVVLQEQSEVPAIAADRDATMYPGAHSLVNAIRATGATPLLFLTWGHRDGLPGMGMNSYEEMQAQLDTGYQEIAQDLGVRVAPVGDAWRQAQGMPNPIDLWQSDGSHPDAAGTYLAACVFYQTLFEQSPQGLAYHATLTQDAAQALQTLAAGTAH
jgi:hypothetical protein